MLPPFYIGSTHQEIYFIPKQRLLMLLYQVEVTIFPKIFIQKIMLSIQFYLFPDVYLNLAIHFFLPFQKRNVKQ